MSRHRLAEASRSGLGFMLALACLAGAAGDGPRKVELGPIKGPDGRSVGMSAPRAGAVVVVFYSPECPISNAYSPTLNRMAADAPTGRVRFVGVCVDPDLTDAEVLAHHKDFGLGFPVVTDRRGTLAATLGAKVTPEAFVVDDSGRVRYHGRIDDQYAARRKANAHPETHELADALAAVLAGREVAVPYVEAVGCPLPEREEKAPRPAPSPGK